MKSVTKRLKVARLERDSITQRDLAARSKMTLLYYWEIENGYREPTKNEAKRIARQLRQPVTTLFPELFPADSQAVSA